MPSGALIDSPNQRWSSANFLRVPDVFVGASFQILEILKYSSGYEIFNHIGMYLTERKRLSMLDAV